MATLPDETVSRLTRLLVDAAHPRRLILFGSHARGDAREDSDVDILVVEERPADRLREMVRLNRLLRGLEVAVDLLVVSEEKFNHWRDTPGNIYFEASSEGRVLYEGA